MSDIHDRLKKTLDELQRELVEADPHDPEVRAILTHVQGELRQALAAAKSPGPPPSEQHSLLGRLKDAGERLESSHPQLSANIGAIVNALSQMGI